MPHYFDGPNLNDSDFERLETQYEVIFNLMSDGKSRTLHEIERITGHPPASISAQLRHMRKPRFGAHIVNRAYLGDGLYSYQLILNRR